MPGKEHVSLRPHGIHEMVEPSATAKNRSDVRTQQTRVQIAQTTPEALQHGLMTIC